MSDDPELGTVRTESDVEPAEIFADPTRPDPEEAIDALVDTGLLTESQATAYIYRLEGASRGLVASRLDVTPSTVDDHQRRAVELVGAARAAIDVLDAYRSPDFPDRCDDCGATLAGSWIEDDDGTPLCPDCADVDPAALEELD